ncbi:thioredoxin [Lacticaseibacillus saniviri]|uniref:thioredoxin n=1 Tax=Lacticaseibacillus saniviri TaxID=931533 RepID=UPI001EDEA674|nr:thioredoxin [Lacticaseibacillus saniviri]MCG4281427.1 thioredoxin [Lacticaseibacillus saniviri]
MSQVATAANLETITQKGTVILDLWAPWCGPCKILSAMLDELETELTGLTVAKLNVDHNQEIAEQYHVMSIPTLIVFQDGKAVEKVTGVYPKPKLKAYLEKKLADAQSTD